MNKLFVLIILLAVVGIGGYLLLNNKSGEKLIGSGSVVQTIPPSPSPSLSPSSSPSFQFNNSTDLKLELDKVSPEIKDSDSDTIKKIIVSF